jgi:hypothetical protein
VFLQEAQDDRPSYALMSPFLPYRDRGELARAISVWFDLATANQMTFLVYSHDESLPIQVDRVDAHGSN